MKKYPPYYGIQKGTASLFTFRDETHPGSEIILFSKQSSISLTIEC